MGSRLFPLHQVRLLSGRILYVSFWLACWPLSTSDPLSQGLLILNPSTNWKRDGGSGKSWLALKVQFRYLLTGFMLCQANKWFLVCIQFKHLIYSGHAKPLFVLPAYSSTSHFTDKVSPPLGGSSFVCLWAKSCRKKPLRLF
jgi:hypothetical protein